ncbi:GNAT family N-acetyltransferase [Tabrizicola sp.]|uniref:GNAT family N-acetyltransferase n=1 Tax=Tabrizicola sp. TaxID=2005166 RepID=UPI002FDDF124
MSVTPISIAREDPDSAAARACLRAYFALLAERIPGIDTTHVPDPDPEAEAYRPPQGTFLIAREGGTVLGCVSLKPVDTTLGEVKRLWVDPAARGRGLARRLMDEVETFARSVGMTHLRLDTNSALTEALALYGKAGWKPIAPFTRAFPATDWFGKRL